MVVGGFTGFLGGLFGKGGSAIATPLLHLVGVSPFAALASPLPATIPATAIAAWAYHRAGQIDHHVLGRLLVAGVPATIVGAVLTRWVGGGALILATDVVVALLGVRLLSCRHPRHPAARPAPDESELAALGPPLSAAGAGTAIVAPPAEGSGGRGPDGGDDQSDPGRRWARGGDWTVTAVGVAAGLISGLLGNSGGFLLAPLGVTVLGLPLKRALGTSLAAAAVLAIPGTVVHAALGHIDWSVSLVFGLASIPLSAVGARLALRSAADRLELVFGAALVLLGGGLLLIR
jgi:uncharacterized membrane protein YfcA